ncbi:MAG TPA: ABC transporter substrate-binding protein [Gaiellaceae bacterium]|nr:ABC transporter substrate-binding protein [Gaiellaceae bacterium]
MKRTKLFVVVGAAVSALAASAVGGVAAHSASAASKKAVKIAFSAATPQVEKIPTIMAADALKAQGYPVTTTFLQTSEDPVQAVVRGDADFGSASASTVLQAISKGAPVTAVMSANSPAYQIVAPTSVTSPAGLDGKRVGIHAAVSSTTLYTNLMLAKFPNAKPNILVVPGSANRIRALAAGQLDASAIQLSDMPTLEQLAPGKFHVIYDVAQKYPFLMDAVIFVRTSFLKTDRPLITTVLKAILAQQKLVYAKPQALADAIQKYVPNMDAATSQRDANVYTTDKVWATNGGFTKQDIQYTLNAMQFGGFLSSPLSLDKCCDLSIVKAINAPTTVFATVSGTKKTTVVLRPRLKFQAGTYVFTVTDKSKVDGFTLVGPGVKKSTGAKFRGKATWKLTLKSGKYTYGPLVGKHGHKTLVVK